MVVAPQRVILALLIAGSAGAQEIGETRVMGGDPPEWAQRPPADGFVGLSEPSRTEASAQSDAILNARLQILDALGVQIRHEVLRAVLTSSGKGDLDPNRADAFGADRAATVGQSLIKVRATQFHREKWARTLEREGAPDKVEYYWKVWALVPFAKSDHERFVREWFDSSLALANKRLAAAQKVAPGLAGNAIRAYASVIYALHDILQITGLDGSMRERGQDARGQALEAIRGLLFGSIELASARSCDLVAPNGGDLVVHAKVARAKDARTGLAGLPVTIRALSLGGDLRDELTGWTKGTGLASVNVPLGDCSGGCRIETYAGPPGLMPGEWEQLPNTAWTVTEVPGIVKVTSQEAISGGGGRGGIAGRLTSELEGLGMRIVRAGGDLDGCESAVVDVRSEARLLPAGPLGDDIKSVEISVQVKVRTAGGAELGSASFEGTPFDLRGHGLDLGTAVADAYRFARDPRALPWILERVTGILRRVGPGEKGGR